MKHTDRQGALECGEAAGECCLQLGGEEDSQLCDDASCDQLMRGHIKGWVPHLNTCREGHEGVKQFRKRREAIVATFGEVEPTAIAPRSRRKMPGR